MTQTANQSEKPQSKYAVAESTIQFYFQKTINKRYRPDGILFTTPDLSNYFADLEGRITQISKVIN